MVDSGASPNASLPPEEEQQPSHALIFDQIEKKLKLQSDTFDRLDSKLQQVIAFVGLVFTLGLGVTAAGRTLTPPGLAAALLAAGLFLAAVVICVRAYSPKELHIPPAPRMLYEKYWAASELETRRRLASEWAFKLSVGAIVMLAGSLIYELVRATVW
jgi:hypothetical protein